MNESPIFIVGMPRSGTTLLSCMMNAHSRIAIAYETHYLNIWKKLYSHLDVTNEKDFNIFFDALMRGGQFDRLDLDPNRVRSSITRNPPLSHASIFRHLLQEYAQSKGKVRWGEKTPSHERYIEELLVWYPDARIIYILRDPRAVCASMIGTAYDARSVYVHAKRWKKSVQHINCYALDSRIAVVRYEDLVSDPTRELSRLCEHVGETFDASMLDDSTYSFKHPALFPLHKKAKEHLSYHKSSIPGGMRTENIEKWKDQLSKTQIAIIESITREECIAKSYTLNTEGLTVAQTPSYLVAKTFSGIQKKHADLRLAIPHIPFVTQSITKKLFTKTS